MYSIWHKNTLPYIYDILKKKGEEYANSMLIQINI